MSLAITDRKQHQWRPGGCVRIFLQFLDWNRRLAKKKLASNKLPPPVRAARKMSKQFNADEKMPIAKLLLINDEYTGRFTSKKKLQVEIGNGMRAPGLVARLMGLESMPAANHEKPRKAMDSKGKSAQGLRSGISSIGKAESRSPKLRKTGELLQRQPVEHDQFVRPKIVWKNGSTSRSSNKHHKLTSTLKGPRLLSKSNSSKARLMQAATKFLEPGSRKQYHAKGDIVSPDDFLFSVEATGPSTNLNRPREVLSDSSSMSCTSYDSLVRMSRSGPIRIESLRSDFSLSAFQFNVPSSSRQYSMGNSTMAFMPAEKNSKLNVAIQTEINVPIEACKISEGKHKLQNPQIGFNLKPDYNNPKVSNNFRHSQSSILKQKVADQVTNRPKVYSSEKSLNNLDIRRALIRSSGLMLNDCRGEMGKSWENIASKRKSNFCSEDSGMFGSVLVRESTRERSSIDRNNIGSHNNQAISRKFLVGGLTKEENHDSISKPFSCTFCSTKSLSYNETEESYVDKYQLNGEFSYHKKLLGTMSRNLPSLGRMTWGEKEISSLVEETTRKDELETLDAQSSSSILDELINSLTNRARSEKHGHIYTFGSSSNTDDSHSIRTALSDFSIPQNQMHSTEKENTEKTRFRNAAGFLLMDDDQPSPVPILNASFSDDYYSYGSKCAYSVSVPGNQSRLDSTEKQNTAKYLDTDIKSEVMQSNCEKTQQFMDRNQGKCTQLQRKKLVEARQTFSNAEKNFALYASCGIIDFALESFLIVMLEVTVCAFNVGERTIPGQKDAEDKNHIQRCLFDCMIQSLASRYSHFFKSGYKILPKNPFFQTQNQFMIREVHNEIKGLINLAGKILDDLIQKELYDSTIMWKDCEIEALEAGTLMEREILEALVDEMVTDL